MQGCCFMNVSEDGYPVAAADVAKPCDVLSHVYSDNSMNQVKNGALTSLITYEWLPSVSNISKSHIGVLPIQYHPPAWFSHVLPPTQLYINL